ncbi:MAG: CPBP family intramembrane metalloprotease [Archangium sp.]|nr:CPBP family intramembrane metalloprotease [Archangium sp.]
MEPENETQRPIPLWLVAVVLVAFLVFGAPVQALNAGVGIWLCQGLVFVGLPFFVLRRVGREPAPLLGLSEFTWPSALFGLAIGALVFFAWAVPLMTIAQHVFPPELVKLLDGSAIFRNRTEVELTLIVSGVVIAAPLGEEFFFRGVLQRALLERLDGPRAVVVTALIFSAFHFDPVGLAARFAIGLGVGLLAWRTGSIWPGVFAHAANNGISTLAYFLSSGAEEADLPWPAVAALWLGGNVLLLGAISLARRFPVLVRPASALRDARH